MTGKAKNPHAVKLGKLGGTRKTKTKAIRARTNGVLGGRPKKPTRCRKCNTPCPSAREAWVHCNKNENNH